MWNLNALWRLSPILLFFTILLSFFFILQCKKKLNILCVDICLKLCGIILVFGELAKFIIEKGSFGHLPFYFSSIQIFLIYFLAFYKNKDDDIFKTIYLICLVLSFSTTFLLFFFPYIIVGIIKNPLTDFNGFWIVFSHTLVFFVFGLLLMFRKINFNFKNWVWSIIISFIIAVFMEIISLLINGTFDGTLGDIIGLKHVAWWYPPLWVLSVTVLSGILSYFLRLIPSFYINEKPRWKF